MQEFFNIQDAKVTVALSAKEPLHLHQNPSEPAANGSRCWVMMWILMLIACKSHDRLQCGCCRLTRQYWRGW